MIWLVKFFIQLFKNRFRRLVDSCVVSNTAAEIHLYLRLSTEPFDPNFKSDIAFRAAHVHLRIHSGPTTH